MIIFRKKLIVRFQLKIDYKGYTIVQPVGWVKCFGLKNFNGVYGLKSLSCVRTA